MATKLRNFSRHWAVKTFAFLLCVATVTAFVLTALYGWVYHQHIDVHKHLLGIDYTYAADFWMFTAVFVSLAAAALISFIYLLIVCGRKSHNNGISLSLWDKPWLDVSFLAVILLGVFFAAFATDFLYKTVAYYRGNFWWDADFSQANFNRSQVISGVLLSVWTSLAFWWLLSAVKRLKNRTVLKHTLIFAVLKWFFRGFQWIFRLLRRFVLRPVIRFFRDTVIRFFRDIYLWSPLKIQLILGKAAHFDAVAKGIDRLAKGDYDTPVEEGGSGDLLKMAQNVNAATDGLKAAVQREVTVQRFKTELITNVSHDLRTPLTSVITYADLLQSEGFHSPNAAKYLEVIQQKAGRLQTLTEDLFEAAKASSGETRAETAPLDCDQLISQTLGEMDGLGREVRVSGSCGIVLADGCLLSRVFENLFRNIEKYALEGSRVYIDKAREGGQATVIIRNISAAPLDGEAERLAERFTRGDESRSTEGSGLGLAIVKSFMELQKGSCAIATDGDLFKVTLTLPPAG